MKFKNRNRKIGYIGWFLVWLKDNDKDIIVRQEKNKVYIWRKDTSFDVFIAYLRNQIEKHYIKQSWCSIKHFTNEEIIKEVNELSDDIINTFEQEDYKLILDISDYKFEF